MQEKIKKSICLKFDDEENYALDTVYDLLRNLDDIIKKENIPYLDCGIYGSITSENIQKIYPLLHRLCQLDELTYDSK